MPSLCSGRCVCACLRGCTLVCVSISLAMAVFCHQTLHSSWCWRSPREDAEGPCYSSRGDWIFCWQSYLSMSTFTKNEWLANWHGKPHSWRNSELLRRRAGIMVFYLAPSVCLIYPWKIEINFFCFAPLLIFFFADGDVEPILLRWSTFFLSMVVLYSYRN